MHRTCSIVALFLMVFSPALAQDELIGAPYVPDRALHDVEFVRLEWRDAERERDVPVKIYFPADLADLTEPAPVILFSHGLGGTREGYEYLGRQWAAHGYVVVHLQHLGSDDRVWRDAPDRMAAMGKAANGRNAIDRAKDVQFAVDQLESLNASDVPFKGQLDLAHIGISGHSFGGQTTMLAIGQQLAGGRFAGAIGELSEPRITAAIPMSAAVPAARGNLDDTYSKVAVPVYLMTGTLDDSPLNDTKADDRRLPYDHIRNAPAYLLILQDGDHMVFSGRRVSKPTDGPQQRLIRESTTAFWDAYLKANPEAKHWFAEGGFKDTLADGGTFEQK